jgi:hypothetical protein
MHEVPGSKRPSQRHHPYISLDVVTSRADHEGSIVCITRKVTKSLCSTWMHLQVDERSGFWPDKGSSPSCFPLGSKEGDKQVIWSFSESICIISLVCFRGFFGSLFCLSLQVSRMKPSSQYICIISLVCFRGFFGSLFCLSLQVSRMKPSSQYICIISLVYSCGFFGSPVFLSLQVTRMKPSSQYICIISLVYSCGFFGSPVFLSLQVA